MAGKVESLRKITPKTVMGDEMETAIADVLKDKKPIRLFTVYGIIKKGKPGSGDYGPFMKFLGEVRAKRASDGQEFVAPSMLMPPVLSELLESVVPSDGTTNAVEFAFHVGMKYDKDVATKYIYTAESLIEAKASDAMSALEQLVLKALPAPKK